MRDAVTSSTQPSATLSSLTEAEWQQIVITWNDTDTPYDDERCLHELFEAQVARTPDAVAVTCENHALTYNELNRRANRLAHDLQQRGVGPDVLVAVHMERSLELVVGLLGILKAGGAYVPLDPQYPPERLAYMLMDAGIPVLLTQQRLADRFAEFSGQQVCLDAELELDVAEHQQNPLSRVTPDNLMYVIYTSGSTGRPKGAGVNQRGFVNLLNWFITEFHLAAEDRTLLVSSVSFDLTQKNLYAPLLLGGTLHLLPAEHYDVERIVAAVCDHCITWLNCTPSAFYPLAEHGADGLRMKITLRYVFLGGEPILVSRLANWLEAAPARVEIVNTYGPTECTDICAAHRLPWPQPVAERAVPIGRPIYNAHVYVLDQYLEPVPIGVVGELYVGGTGVGRGYLNNPDLTLAKFMADPFSTAPGARLYRTGDLVRYWPDGNIEFMGRSDFQVKVRGFRIELGEIEATLSQYPAVREVVVLAREVPGRLEDKRVVAYVVPKVAQLDVGELRQFLQERLPDYMVPSAFVMLESLPLTPNGKVDRRALPAWDPSSLTPADTFAAPHTPLQELVADQWAQVLGVERIGLHDNFFELGGHSLLAAQIVVRLRQQLGYDLAIQAIFEKPTVASLAALLESNLRVENTSRPPHIERVARDQPLPLSFSQQQLWLIDQIAPGNVAYNIPLVLRLTGLLNVEVLHACLNEIVRRHEVLRTTFVLAGEQPVQMMAPTLTLPLPLIDLRELLDTEREDRAAQAMREHERQPFDLAHGPLLRVTLFQLGETDYRLSITVHHIVFDGWSVGIFLTELMELYQALAASRPSPLPELPIQYADFAAQQRAWLQDAELDKQLIYWKQQLAGAPALLELPLDRPRPPVQSFRGAHQPIVFTQPVSDRVKTLSRGEHVTSFMLLLTVFEALLQRYTGQTDLVIGLPVANRSWPEIEDLIGYFVNVLVLRIDLTGDPSLRELLKRVRDTLLKAFAHQDLPFPKLVEVLRPERDMSYNPLFQVMFSSTPAVQAPPLPDLDTAFTEPETGIYESADLLLDLVETAQGLTGALGYNVDLFDETTIARMRADYVALLEQITADDADLDRPLSDWLCFIPVPERRSGAIAQPADVLTPADTLAQRKLSLANRRANLTDAKRTLFEKMLRGE